MANYCIHCGTVLHPRFGLCPRCNRERLNQLIYQERGYGTIVRQSSVPAYAQPAAIPVQQPSQTVCRNIAVSGQRRHKPVYKIVLTAILSFVLLMTGFVSMGIVGIRQITSESTLIDIAENAAFSDLTGLLPGDVQKQIYDPVRNYILENTGISLSNGQINSIMDASGYPVYLAEKAAEYATDLYDGTDSFSLSEKEVYRLLRANREEMEAVIKTNMDNASLEQMAKLLANQRWIEMISPAAVKDNTPGVYYSLHFGLSYGAAALFAVVAVMLWLGMLSADFSLGILGGGTALATAGGLFAVPALVVKLSPALLDSLVSNRLLHGLIAAFLQGIFPVSAVVFLAGLTLLLLRAMFSLLYRACR